MRTREKEEVMKNKTGGQLENTMNKKGGSPAHKGKGFGQVHAPKGSSPSQAKFGQIHTVKGGPGRKGKGK